MGLLGRQFRLERSAEDSLLLALSFLTFTVSLFCGYIEGGIGQLISLPLFGIEFHLISTPVWLLSGILCLICLQQLFYKIWTHGVWLIGVYWLTAFGTIILFIMFNEGYVWFIVSLILIFLAIFLMYWMILEIYGLRYNIIGQVPEADRAISLTDWLLSVPSFFICTFISYYYYTKLYLDEEGWFTFGHASEGYLIFQFGVFLSGMYILYIPQTLLGDYLEFSDLDINTSYNVDEEKVAQRLVDYSKNYDEGKIQATLIDLYRMADEDPEAWVQLGEFYPEWSVEEVKLFITKLEDLSSEKE
ncbi:MAG TPA: hypothetical protein QGI59_02120 [Candidatus Poseidoniia archaeon]|jgi:hypothetical protein|nr:hypothetical protein [Candidatus Poseidoniia archaeon]|tara:strand:+ start:3796 stop:4701 length:906 start_codon:yes stop_codon:yes gene_type:complete